LIRDFIWFNSWCFLLFSDLELKPVGILEVKLVQAKGLTNKDIIGKSDPFAVVYVRPLPDKMKTSKTIVSSAFPLFLGVFFPTSV
jgi:Ca2+-dependent lipid-binding protein